MTIDLVNDTGTPLEKQTFTWRELAQSPIGKKSESDAFTRIRVVLMNALEQQANRFQHACAGMNEHLREAAATVRRIEHHQQTMVHWLMPPDRSALEATLAYEQAAVEITAAVALQEPDAYFAQVYRFALLEHTDHLYRYARALERLEHRDAAEILQGHTDVRRGRPTAEEHRVPTDDLRDHYNRRSASPLTKLDALTLLAAEHQIRDFYMNVGATPADPLARQLFAEIASVEEQHVTQAGSIIDPGETWLERWLLHEASELYAYYSCAASETNPRVRAIWERFVDYELGHLHLVRSLFAKHERRDAAEILPAELPAPLPFRSHRDFVRATLDAEVDLRAERTQFVDKHDEGRESIQYRERLNASGSPSTAIAAGDLQELDIQEVVP